MSEKQTTTIEQKGSLSENENQTSDGGGQNTRINGAKNEANVSSKNDETDRANENSENESGESEENSPDANSDAKSKPNWFVRLALIGIGILAIALALIFGIVPRLTRARETKETAEQHQNAVPKVNVAKPQLASETSELSLPGTTEGIEETAINARASGYVTRRFVDIGDRVRAGQVLAEIDTPEIDEQLRQARQQVAQAAQQVAGAQQEVAQARQGLNQARAGLEQANAQFKQARTNQNLANVTSNRSTNLAQKGLVSRQEADERSAALEAREADTEVALANIGDREANIAAQQAVINTRLAGVAAQQANVEALKSNVRRLQDLQGFRRITAPFNGIITARNVDVGGLVSSGGASSGSTGAAGGGSESSGGGNGASGGSSPNGGAATTGGLFRVARLDAMRTYINVPQTFAASIKPGLETQVEIKELPQRLFKGRVTRTSNSLDPNSRTLLAEILIGNESGQLLPGMYAQIKLAVPRTVRAVLIPSSALISRADGTSVIVVNPDRTIHYQAVEVGRDYGKQIEILSGLGTENSVVTNPTDSLSENARVEAQEAPPPDAGNGSQSGKQQNQQPADNKQNGAQQQPNSSNSGGGK